MHRIFRILFWQDRVDTVVLKNKHRVFDVFLHRLLQFYFENDLFDIVNAKPLRKILGLSDMFSTSQFILILVFL